MADDLVVPVRDNETRSDEFHVAVNSNGLKLKERLLERQDSATKTRGFDLHETQHYLDILDPVFAHEELSKRHGGGKPHKLKICVSTKTIKHDRTTISDVDPIENTRNAVWLLAVSVNAEDGDKIGQSFNLGTRFDIVEGEIYVSYKVE
ncbi:hypothetical protein MBLNU13_g09837t1 [Cladosporium sp. NU13]